MTQKLDFDNSEQIMNMIVKNGELPRYIYKYTDIESLKLILKNATLKFSKPSDFNDPFDCNITIDTNNSTEEIDAYIEMLRQNESLTDEQIKIKRKKYHNPDELFALTNKSVKESKEILGVTCFSRLFDNILMWSHYSDKHKGVCIKFDLLSDADFFMTPFIVEYSDKYPTYNYLSNREGLAQFLLKTKSIDWEYEKEIRVMKRGHGFYSFQKDSLVEIIFGAKTNNLEKVELKRLVDKFGYNKTDFKTAKISETDFKLEIE